MFSFDVMYNGSRQNGLYLLKHNWGAWPRQKRRFRINIQHVYHPGTSPVWNPALPAGHGLPGVSNGNENSGIYFNFAYPQLDQWLRETGWNNDVFNDVDLVREGVIIRRGRIRVWRAPARGRGRSGNDNYVKRKLGLDQDSNHYLAYAHGRWEGFTNYHRGSDGSIYRFRPGDVLIKIHNTYADMLRHLRFYKNRYRDINLIFVSMNIIYKVLELEKGMLKEQLLWNKIMVQKIIQ